MKVTITVEAETEYLGDVTHSCTIDAMTMGDALERARPYFVREHSIAIETLKEMRNQ